MPEFIKKLCEQCDDYINKICENETDKNRLIQIIEALNEGQNSLGLMRGKVIKASYKLRK